ncbi:hypothetical protein GGR57DRAFT_508487 [Xylariaceae sp. FL1272]|nr:hypothetical protein GGR57DRAFT_508487 [Xylariaceae sp. FL1272]
MSQITMLSLLYLAFANLASAVGNSSTISVFAPGTQVDEAVVNAKGSGFFTGLTGPGTYCPLDPSQCPPVRGTLIVGLLGGMATEVPGGQQIYVQPDGQIKFTVAHSAGMAPGSLLDGWFLKTVVSDCAADVVVADFKPHDGSSDGGVTLCPDVPPFLESSGAQFSVYAKTEAFNVTGCTDIVGLVLTDTQFQYGAWEYT